MGSCFPNFVPQNQVMGDVEPTVSLHCFLFSPLSGFALILSQESKHRINLCFQFQFNWAISELQVNLAGRRKFRDESLFLGADT